MYVWCKKEVAILLAVSSLMEIVRFLFYAQLPWNPFAFTDGCDGVGSGWTNFEIHAQRRSLNIRKVIKTKQVERYTVAKC